jgi:hypothetical protein
MSGRQTSRLGEPIELPWWVLALGALPALAILAGLLVPAALPVRLAAVLPSLALLGVIVRVARRVASPSMQSVWISAAYGVWVVFPVAWAVVVFSPHR